MEETQNITQQATSLAKQVRPEGQVSSELGMQRILLEDLGSAIESLEGRLSPVLEGPRENGPDSKTDSPPRVNLADSIYRGNEVLRLAVLRIRDIEDRVQI